jgi:hypothetical protein
MLSPDSDPPRAQYLRARSLGRALSSSCTESANDHTTLIRALSLANAPQEEKVGDNSPRNDRLSYMLEQIVSYGKPIEEVVVEMRHATFVQSLALARSISRRSLESLHSNNHEQL